MILICIVLLMSVSLFLLIKKYRKIKKENELLKDKYSLIMNIEEEYNKKALEFEEQEKQIKQLKEAYKEKYNIYSELEKKVKLFDDEYKAADVGIYKPVFDFQTSKMYEQKIKANFEEQKRLFNEGKAVICKTNWIVSGSKANGQKMIEKEIALTLLAFNAQCDEQIRKIRWNNLGLIEQRIIKLYTNINKKNTLHDIVISEKYLQLKKEEIRLFYELQQKIYQEKEEAREIREQQREEQKLLEEAEKAKQQREEEERQKAELEKLKQEFYEKGQLDKAKECENELIEKDKIIEKLQRTESNAQKTKFGHVYIISNIGSFGENIYKIGMTRRSEPKDRVDELGDASVPFKFFINGMIESENAPALETELHKRFADKIVNRINMRKEFFNVSLDEIEQAANEITGGDMVFRRCWDTSFYEDNDMQDYIQTLEIIKQQNNITSVSPQSEENLPQNI